MKVTRITLDSELGLVELKTGPGGDGDYVLLPIDIPPTAERYLRFPGEASVAEAPEEGEGAPYYSGLRESPDEAREGGLVKDFLKHPGDYLGPLQHGSYLYHEDGDEVQLYNNDGTPNGTLFIPSEVKGSIVAAGGWSVPKDQAYDYNTTPGVGAYDAEIADPPRWERGGIKYPALPKDHPSVLAGHETAEKELNSYLAADECETISVTNNAGETVSTECDGHCGAHPVDESIEFPGTATIEEVAEALKLDTKIVAAGLTLDSNGLHPTGKDGGFWEEKIAERERHTGPATVTNPVVVFAQDYGHGYRLTSPALPQWTRTINHYDLHRVPGLVSAALGERTTVAITIIEEQ
jgi:hypothetical protein